MNETELTVAGRVVADPEHRTTRSGMHFTTCRLATTVRRRTTEGVFVDASTSFYNVAAFRSLGMNAHASLRKGDPVVVNGRVTINTWQRADESWGTSAEIEAIALGHDLTYGTTAYTKAGRSVVDEGAEEAAHRSFTEMTDRIAGGDGQAWGSPPPPGEADSSGSRSEQADEETSEDVPLSA
ncbi:MAG: single-stranded DNA-binding protein [Janibacter sp.]